ncbi:MAG: Do family serine endopeptidase [Clostridiales bacterium]|nr:Do family serine endopeptidase [Clostridiales bacterium]
MKKYVWIAAISFILGLLAAGYVFVYVPGKNTPDIAYNTDRSPSLASPLYAASRSSAAELRPDLDFVTVAEKVGPAVIKIEAEKVEKVRGFGFGDEWPFEDFWDRFFGRPRDKEQEFRSTAQGTGFFLSEDGYILTNNHIVESSVKVKISTIQGEDFAAKIVGTDSKTDLALLKIEGKNLPYVELGDSGSLKVGEWVLAIGNPFGLEHTVTAGIVSAKGRQLGVGGNVPEYQDFIQTDAAINRGNSGGPLVNMKGEVVGITSNILAPAGGNIGLGFAIPSTLAKKVIAQLKEKGRVIRGKIGVTITPLTEDDKEAFKLKDKRGALVNSVERGGPADKAGIKPYDVIIAVDGEKVKDPNDLKFKIADIQPGKKVDVTIIRDGKDLRLTVTVEELEPQEAKPAAAGSEKDLGFSVRELTPGLAQRYGYRTQEGLVITQIKRYSEADRKGLIVGDIILEVNRKKVTRVEDIEKMLKKVESGEVILLLVRREADGESIDRIVTLRVP